jgi:hypothetical protein
MMVLSILKDLTYNMICCVVNLGPAIYSVFRAVQLLVPTASPSLYQGRDRNSLLRKGSAIFLLQVYTVYMVIVTLWEHLLK